jgi:TrmH family RNA methyltransferase
MITSLQSPHVEAVKALLGSRGVKERHERGKYVIESVQNIKAALASNETEIESIFYTQEGLERLGSFYHSNLIEVSPQVMKAMTDTVSPQGVLAIAKLKRRALSELQGLKTAKFAYFWQIQDPGNAGTIIRTADAFGFDAVIFSDSSVDLYSPKVIRSTAGSFWQTKVLDEVSVEEIKEFAEQTVSALFATKSDGALSLRDAARESVGKPSIWIFGNEARGLPPEVEASLGAKSVSIPMAGKTESLNLATAASVVMYAVANADK